MIDTIVFSKNRAMQLDLLLRTAKQYAPQLNLKCLYTYTNDKHKKSYETLENEHSNIEFILERNIKQQLIDAIDTELMGFLVDDDVFFKSIPTDIRLKSFETYSVRLGENIKNKKHFDYKISVDGNIFCGTTMKDFLKKLPKQAFNTPNYLESALIGNFNNKINVLYDRQCLVGIPHNRVSTSSKCSFSGKYNEDNLCDLYNSGLKIIFDEKKFNNITDTHDNNIEYLFF